MPVKNVPGDERVQIVSEDILDSDAVTIRAVEDGTDVRLFSSEAEEGPGIPLRADDEIPVEEEEGFSNASTTDGLWAETADSGSTQLIILKGVALKRNVRRRVETTVSNIIETNNYVQGDDFEVDGSAYPYTYDPSFVVQEVLITESADVVMDVTTVDDNVISIPLKGALLVEDHLAIKQIEFRDPNGTAAPIAGSYHGGKTE